MSNSSSQWEHPHLAKYRKSAGPNTFLFRQGEPGSTLIILIRGIVELRAERDGHSLLVAMARVGDFLGEKSVVGPQPHKRFFSAVTKTPVDYLELDLAALAVLEGRNPELFKDLLKEMFRIAARRLDQSNYMNRVLRSSRNPTRLVNLILHFAICTGRKLTQGREVELSLDRIRYFIDMSQFEVEECMKTLVDNRVLVPSGDGLYVIPSDEKLLGAVSLLKEALPQLQAI